MPPGEKPPRTEVPPSADNTGSLSLGTVGLPPTPAGSGSARGSYVPTFGAGEVVADRYRILRFIAKGGMGEVYEAEDLELHERIALKTVRAEMAQDEDTVQRFKREIQLSRKVSHPNVCRIFDLGRHRLPATPESPEGAVLFLTMELLPGETLSERLRARGRLQPVDAMPIVRQMAAALARAHEAGIVHRDFKSSNVILVPSQVGERAVVTDFGLARGLADASGMASMTGAGVIVGTPAYMAPEQVETGKVGPSADIYALGVVLYEMLTGVQPFTGDSPLSIALRRLKEKPAPPRVVVAGIDPVWESAILRCLERDPADRFATADDLVKALDGQAVPTGRRGRRSMLAAVAGLVAVALAGGYWLAKLRVAPGSVVASPPPSPAPAPVKLRKAVAVLGFKNLGRTEAGWVSTAVAEMLRTELAAGGKVSVVPGENVARMKLELALAETDSLARDTLGRIRANVGADWVVLGSYLAAGKGKLRVDLRLQETGQGETIASSAAEGTEDEIFQLVSQAGAKLRDALGLGAVSPLEASAVRASFPANPTAAQLYSEGLAKLRVFDPLSAQKLFAKAAGADSRHPLIHAGLASAWAALGYDEAARAESKLAFELSNDLSREERLAIQGLHNETVADWDKAIETYKALLVFFPDRLDYGLRLAGALVAAGRGSDALETLAELRRLPAPAADDPRIDLAEGEAAKSLTQFPRQRTAAVAAAAKAQKQGAKLLLAQARLAEGTALVNLGKLDESRRACEQAGELFAAAGDRSGVARSENIIAVAYARAGDFQNARDRFQQALGAFRQIGDKRGIGLQLGNVGNASLMLNRPAEARTLYQEALAVYQEIADKNGYARNLNNLAKAIEMGGDLEGARRTFDQAAEAYRQLGATRNVALALANVGEILHKLKRPDAAREKYEASLRLSREVDAKADTATTLGLLARVLVEKQDFVGATKLLEEAASLFRAEGDREGEQGTLRAWADALERRGDKAGARSLTERAAKLAASPSAR